jgi:hypothetical protein
MLLPLFIAILLSGICRSKSNKPDMLPNVSNHLRLDCNFTRLVIGLIYMIDFRCSTRRCGQGRPLAVFQLGSVSLP